MVRTIAGIGSLVSEESAASSFAFSNFRLGEVRGWRRAFNQANWVNVAHGWGSEALGRTAALSMVPADADFVSCVALLDVQDDELASFYERETGYNIRSTPFWERSADGTMVQRGEALLCTACADDAEADALWRPGGAMERHCAGSTYVADWMLRSLRPLWPPPTSQLLPSQGYLELCAEAHQQAGMLDHFLDSTLLVDGVTTLREHCTRDPEAQLLLNALMMSAQGGTEECRAPVLLDSTPSPVVTFGIATQGATIADVPLNALFDGRELCMVVLHDRHAQRVLLEVNNDLGWRLHFGCVGKFDSTSSHAQARGFTASELHAQSDAWSVAEAAAADELAAAGVRLCTSATRRAGLMLFSFPSHPPLRVRVLEATPDATSPQPGVWYEVGKVPYERMWADDIVWMPSLLESSTSYFEGHFVFDGPPGPQSQLVRHNWRRVCSDKI